MDKCLAKKAAALRFCRSWSNSCPLVFLLVSSEQFLFHVLCNSAGVCQYEEVTCLPVSQGISPCAFGYDTLWEEQPGCCMPCICTNKAVVEGENVNCWRKPIFRPVAKDTQIQILAVCSMGDHHVCPHALLSFLLLVPWNCTRLWFPPRAERNVG